MATTAPALAQEVQQQLLKRRNTRFGYQMILTVTLQLPHGQKYLYHMVPAHGVIFQQK